MGFLEEIKGMPFYIIEKVNFKDRTIYIQFKSGNHLNATCPDGNDQYDILKDAMLKKLGKDKVEIHDN
jgi:hypothetical protein